MSQQLGRAAASAPGTDRRRGGVRRRTAVLPPPPPATRPAPAPPPPPLPVVAPEDLVVPPGEVVPVNRPAGSPRCDLNAYLRAILTARVYEIAVETPLDKAARLSERVGNTVLLKREDAQPVFSFKLRGAYNTIANLPADVLAAGVVTASAGNHAQGVALSAQRLGLSAVVCMPTTTPAIKIESVRRMGAEVRLVGDTFDETAAFARRLALADGRAYIPPFDSPAVIAGQGTVGMEILRQVGSAPLHAIFVPVGGGGLLAGVGAYVKCVRPDVLVIGVEPAGANSMAHSLRAGRRVTLSRVDGFADGVAVKTVGEETFRVACDVCDGIVLVDTDAICAAIKDVFEDTRSILEPAGALALAGAKAYLAAQGLKGARVVAIASGANMNFDRLRLVAQLADVGLRTEAVLATRIPEEAGAFKRFARAVCGAPGDPGGPLDITEFKYRYAGPSMPHASHAYHAGEGVASPPPRPALVLFSVALRVEGQREALLSRLSAAGLDTTDLSSNELALVHARHLVGGSATAGAVPFERLLSLAFPEKPGALASFLDAVSPAWNISLFHYRAAGGAVANVLVGLQVPPEERALCDAALNKVGYDWTDETGNAAWKLFG